MSKWNDAPPRLLLASMAATVVVLAASSAATAKMVCYKDPGRGTVCTKVN